LWTDDGNRLFVATHYPWFLKTFDDLPKNIHRVDTVRYMYLHRFGGVYSDMDFESIRPMDDYLKGKQLILGRMGDDEEFGHSIPNALMASIPGHPFWIKVLQYITDNYKKDLGVEGVCLSDLYIDYRTRNAFQCLQESHQ
jgi:mannosyltransferase OCH1-like enzyme